MLIHLYRRGQVLIERVLGLMTVLLVLLILNLVYSKFRGGKDKQLIVHFAMDQAETVSFGTLAGPGYSARYR